MKHSKCVTNAFILVVLLLFVSARHAHAYIDPGTGSYVIQLIIAALAGAAFAVKVYWGKIRTLFSKPSSKGPETGDESEEG